MVKRNDLEFPCLNLSNQIRGLLLEYGIVINKGMKPPPLPLNEIHMASLQLLQEEYKKLSGFQRVLFPSSVNNALNALNDGCTIDSMVAIEQCHPAIHFFKHKQHKMLPAQHFNFKYNRMFQNQWYNNLKK